MNVKREFRRAPLFTALAFTATIALLNTVSLKANADDEPCYLNVCTANQCLICVAPTDIPHRYSVNCGTPQPNGSCIYHDTKYANEDPLYGTGVCAHCTTMVP